MVLAELKEQPGYFEPEIQTAVGVKRKHGNSLNRAKLMTNLGIFIFAFCIVGVSLYIHSALLGYQIVALKNDISTIENENSRLEYNIAQLSSLERVQSVAEQNLGMLRPDSKNMIACGGKSMLTQPIDAETPEVSGRPVIAKEKSQHVIASIVGRLASEISSE